MELDTAKKLCSLGRMFFFFFTVLFYSLSHSWRNTDPHGHSAKYTNSTSLHGLQYCCLKFDFRTLPAEPDGQIETKVVGPGKLKVYTEGYLHARGFSFWLTCLFLSLIEAPPLFSWAASLYDLFSHPLGLLHMALVVLSQTLLEFLSFSFFLPCQFSWCTLTYPSQKALFAVNRIFSSVNFNYFQRFPALFSVILNFS